MKLLFKVALLIVFAQYNSFAQDTIQRVLKVDELFSLAQQNSKKLAISKEGIALSHKKTEIAKSARLPEISTSASVGYISSATVLNPDFKYTETIAIPHFSNNYDLEASQVLYNGNAVNNSIAKAKLEQKLSELSYDKDSEEIKITLLAQYLDLYNLYNQQKVLKNNINLAKTRLKNIKDLNKEGMVTKNDVIRSELQIADLTLMADKVNNNIAIINKELCVILGMNDNTRIMVDPAITMIQPEENTYQGYLSTAFSQTPAMRANSVYEQIADKNIKIAKAQKLPKISLYATDGMVRPYIYVMPPLDDYINLYQAGVKLTYNISSIYHAKEHIEEAEIQKSIQQKKSELVHDQTELEVNAAYIKYEEAKKEFTTQEKSRVLADDNYRIVEKKYLNQLALLTDMLDASSAKIAAELNLSNAGVNIIYRWYQLQKATGNLY